MYKKIYTLCTLLVLFFKNYSAKRTFSLPFSRSLAFYKSGSSSLHGRLRVAYRCYTPCTSIINNNDLGNCSERPAIRWDEKIRDTGLSLESTPTFSLIPFFFAVFSPHRLRYLFALHAVLPICINLESDRIIILATATSVLPATLTACAIAAVTTDWFNQPSIVMLTTITEMLNRRLDSN